MTQTASNTKTSASTSQPEAGRASSLSPALVDVLVCPLTRSKLVVDGDDLLATVGGLRYTVRDGIPIMLIDEATLPPGVANLDEFKKKFAQHIPA
jgi:uncharacterized protein